METIATTSKLTPAEKIHLSLTSTQPEALSDPESNFKQDLRLSPLAIDFHPPSTTPSLTKQPTKDKCQVPWQIQATACLSTVPLRPASLAEAEDSFTTAAPIHPVSSKVTTDPSVPTLPQDDSSIPLVAPAPVPNDGVASSGESVLSASGTLLPTQLRRLSHTIPLSRTSTTHTLTALDPAHSTAQFDSQQFKSTLVELARLTEKLESLNDLVLEAMTDGTAVTQPEDTATLNRDRLGIAITITELVLKTWPCICQVLPGPQPAKATKQKSKAATQLKNAIASFWSAQSCFQDKAQLVLDIYNDPMEWEREDSVRILRSRHLNNLLSCSLDTSQIEDLSQQLKADQERMTHLTDQLQGIWFGIVVAPGDPRQQKTISLVSNDSCALQQTALDGCQESIRRRLARYGRTKRAALKNMVKGW